MIDKDDETYALKCEHVMHKLCFEQWISFHKDCHRCLQSIEPSLANEEGALDA
jgi:predicted SAM-dependent methyltransferase